MRVAFSSNLGICVDCGKRQVVPSVEVDFMVDYGDGVCQECYEANNPEMSKEEYDKLLESIEGNYSHELVNNERIDDEDLLPF